MVTNLRFRKLTLIFGLSVVFLWLAYLSFNDKSYKNMPPFSAGLENSDRNVYFIQFDKDCYPCKNLGYAIVEHPIYGVYVINDYLLSYERTGEKKYLEAAEKVAKAAINRMEKIKNYDALGFFYPKKFLNGYSFWRRMYSGLTQSYYAVSFYTLYQKTKNKTFLEASEQCFNSLFVPADEGGVFYKKGDIQFVAEVPFEIPDMVLNGYISAALNIRKYGNLNKQYQQRSQQASDAIIKSIKKFLPLYDVPTYLLSRYMLTGSMKFDLSVPDNTKIKGIYVEIPGWGKRLIPVLDPKDTTYRCSYIDQNTVTKTAEGFKNVSGKKIKLNLLVSRFSYPKENILFIEYESENEGLVQLHGYVGQFIPNTTDLGKVKKKHIFTEEIQKNTQHTLQISIPWLGDGVFGNIVHWNRQKANKLYNGYHYMHISQLKDLYKIDPDPIYLKYAKKWEDYIKQWKDFPLYQRSDLSYDRFG